MKRFGWIAVAGAAIVAALGVFQPRATSTDHAAEMPPGRVTSEGSEATATRPQAPPEPHSVEPQPPKAADARSTRRTIDRTFRPPRLAEVPEADIDRAIARLAADDLASADDRATWNTQLEALTVLAPCIEALDRDWPDEAHAIIHVVLEIPADGDRFRGTAVAGRVDLENSKSALPADAMPAVEACARRAFLGLTSEITTPIEVPQYHWFFNLRLPPDEEQFPWKLLRTGKYTGEH